MKRPSNEALLVLAVAVAAGGGFFTLQGQAPSTKGQSVEYATSLKGRTPNQRHNAILSTRKINGSVIAPGATFSFNQTCGSWSRDAGYRRAPVSYNGTLIDAWGGGVCQTTTTLYNVALKSGFDITERHTHRFAPSYCPPGRDAAVAFSGIDLRFKNTWEVPITLHAKVDGDLLRISFTASKIPVDLPQVETVVRQKTEPANYYIVSSTGTRKTKNAGKPGWDVVTYRRWKDRREQVAINSYPAMNRIVEE